MSKESSYWWGYDMGNPQSYTKAIKQLVRIARLTPEYAEWQKQTKIGAGDICPICGAEYMYVRPETHHYPLTLFEVIENKLQEYIHSNFLDDIQPLELLKEIMNDHLQNNAACVVICKACHEKYHMQDPQTMKEIERLYNGSIKGRS